MKDLDTLRKEIDAIDEKLIKLLSKRAVLGQKVAATKKRDNKPIYYPARERDILKKVAERNGGPLADEALQAIFREIFSATRSVEKGLTIACLGPEGTFSHLAARRSFGQSAGYQYEKSIEAVFAAVEKGTVDFGVVPVENSLEGAVAQTLDLLISSRTAIYGESYLAIHPNLLSKEKSLASITTLYTHYMPLAQSRAWVSQNLPNVTIVETASSSVAVKRAASEKGAAAIGSAETAAMYKIGILAERIESGVQNQTRFFILAPEESPRSGADKTSLCLTVGDTPGALFKILKPFSDRGVNLSRIESRPIKTSEWEYVFFVDLVGHKSDTKVAEALGKVEKLTRTLKVLGSYPDARA